MASRNPSQDRERLDRSWFKFMDVLQQKSGRNVCVDFSAWNTAKLKVNRLLGLRH